MYGFNVSGIISALSDNIYWGKKDLIISDATCGILYTVSLYIRYGTNSAPAPSSTDHIVLIKEGQLLSCDAVLSGLWNLSHPVGCRIKDTSGNIVFSKTVTLVAGTPMDWNSFFRNVLLPTGYYSIEWNVCEGHASHNLTVSAQPQDYVTNNIDINLVVTDTSDINPYAVWNSVKEDVIAEMLVYNTTVELLHAEIKGKNFIIFHTRVTAPAEGTSTADIGLLALGFIPIVIILSLIALTAYYVFALPAMEERKIAEYAYNTNMQTYTYGDCANMTYNSWIACMASKYPDVWANIKDVIVEPKPPNGGEEPDWFDYLTYGIIAIFALAGLYVGVKYVLPAIGSLRKPAKE
jgi:hypothetical protein